MSLLSGISNFRYMWQLEVVTPSATTDKTAIFDEMFIYFRS
jgi:hypothetical protein